MKGSLEGILPMTGLLLIALILTVQIVPIGEALNVVVSESSEDIEDLVQTRTNYDYLETHYMPSAIKYSVNNAAYELDDGGINWESEASSASEPYHIVGSVVDEWESDSVSNIDSRLENYQCSIEHDIINRIYPGESGYSLYNTDGIETVEFEAFTFNPVKVSCNAQTEYITQTYSAEATEPNRYIELVKPASTFFYEIRNEDIQERVEDEYTGTSTNCGSYDYEGAEDDAESSYNSDTFSSSDAYSAIDNLAPGIDISHDSEDHYTGTVTDTDSYGGCGDQYCDGSWVSIPPELGGGEYCDGSMEYEDEYKDVEYTLNPSYTSFDFRAEDSEKKVLAEGDFRHLEIEVNDFRANY